MLFSLNSLGHSLGTSGITNDPRLLGFALLLPALILSLIAQSRVKSVYQKYAQKKSAMNVLNVQAANELLRRSGIFDVSVNVGGRDLSDHYDPLAKQITLSANPEINTSVAAIAVAAHECGHAMQHAQHYGLLRLRTALVKVANVASTISIPLFILGIILGFTKLAMAGAIAYCGVWLFHLVTLPVEFNASRRAMVALRSTGMLTEQELVGARKVLTAAAWTYIAAMLLSLAQALRLFSMAGRRR